MVSGSVATRRQIGNSCTCPGPLPERRLDRPPAADFSRTSTPSQRVNPHAPEMHKGETSFLAAVKRRNMGRNSQHHYNRQNPFHDAYLKSQMETDVSFV